MGEIFKDVSELEEFFKNLGIEYRFSCYHEKNGEGCHLLGDYMSQIQNDMKRSAKVYRDNCEDNRFARSCTQFGVSLLLGKGCEKDPKKAVEYFSRGCELSDNEGCFYAGQCLSGDDPSYKSIIDSNIKKSIECLEKGCHSDKNTSISAECCFYAHSFYLGGRPGLEKNPSKAFQFAQRGCELDSLGACNNLSQMYALGVGTEKDELLAKKYRMKSKEMIEQMRSNRTLETQRT